ncbi:MAG: patatin-like phospholipase family protein [Clostridia bacterium]|nr:patatin-like phospholipase family protein [Clostridia bacterium]
MSKKLGLALGSGGSRGVAHVGLLKALEEEGIKPDFIAGSSMGAVVGGVYASGVSAKRMHEIVLKLRKRDIISINPAALSQMSLLRSGKVRDLLCENLALKNIEDFPVKFKCVATDILSGKEHVFESGDAAFAIQASSTIPAVFRPLKYENELLVDGGCVCRVPIKIVKEMGADVVIAMDVLKNCSERIDDVHGILNMVLRVYDIMDAQNSALRYERDKSMCDMLLQPEMKGMSQYVIKDLDKAFEEGYLLAKKNMPKIKELLG